MEDRDDERKERLIVEMSQAIDAPLESVRLIIREMTEARFGIDGKRAMKDGH